MSSGNKKKKSTTSGGIDTILTQYGKHLAVGEQMRVTLVKGPLYAQMQQPDPVNPKAPVEQFPLMAKFPETVTRPDLTRPPWNTARLYQQDVPKAMEDSDEEDTGDKLQPKKRWRQRKEVPKRQWVLQEQVEFLETMMAKRQKTTVQKSPKDQISTRYEGMPEHNPSQYVVLSVSKEHRHDVDNMDDDNSNKNPSEMLQVTLLPTPFATVTFSQPKARKTLSMSEAEQAIEDQRGKMTRFMMHDKQRLLHAAAGAPAVPQNYQSRKRLLGKLTTKKVPGTEDDPEEDDDIMGDLAFRNRKGTGGRARKELLNSLGDSDMKVDADGVIGGANDAEFGRGNKFGRFKADNNAEGAKSGGDEGGDDGTTGAGAAKTVQSESVSNDGLAMADDFYQRDVSAEYEELDYDANEQFDDDDVDVGETEVAVEAGGYADEDDDEDLEEEELMGERPSGAEGLASLAGFKLMLAKARGEITPEQAAEQAEGAKAQQEAMSKRELENYKKSKDQQPGDQDHLSAIMMAAEKAREEAQKKKPTEVAPAAAAAPVTQTLNQHDENGQRIISLEAVRREIWLNHGTMPMKRLMKIFDVKKKSAPERRSRFLECVKELCTMETDPIGRRMLVLKQHYANMG